jgi:hypothetical protein
LRNREKACDNFGIGETLATCRHGEGSEAIHASADAHFCCLSTVACRSEEIDCFVASVDRNSGVTY